MDFLKRLGIERTNAGGYSAAGWSGSGVTLESFNPTNGEAIAPVSLCTEQDYETIIEQATQAFGKWHTLPAPRRGEVVRRSEEHTSELQSQSTISYAVF